MRFSATMNRVCCSQWRAIENRAIGILFGLFGANGDGAAAFETADNDGIALFVSVDNGPQIKIGGFAPDASGTSDLLVDTDLDGVGDGSRLSVRFSAHSFQFTAHGSVLDVIVALTSTASDEHLAVDNLWLIGAGLPGDYNSDGVVNAADYVVWRNNNGTNVALANERADANTPGVADQEDYDFWVAQYSGGMGTAHGVGVPEPTAWLLVAIAALAWAGSRRSFSSTRRIVA